MSQKTLHISSSAPAPQEVPAPLPLRVLVEAANVILTPLVTRLGAPQAVAFRTALLTHIDQEHQHLIVDLEQVEWMDSSALCVLVAAFQQTGRAGGSLAVRALQPGVRALFAQTRLDRVIPLSGPPHVAFVPKRKLCIIRRWTRRELVTARHWSFGAPAAASTAERRSRSAEGTRASGA